MKQLNFELGHHTEKERGGEGGACREVNVMAGHCLVL